MTAFVLSLLLGQTPDYPQLCAHPLRAGAALRVGRSAVAPSDATVIEATANSVRLRACAYENHEVLEIDVVVSRAERVLVEKGAKVKAGDAVAIGGVTLLDGAPVRSFFARHPFLFEPAAEPVLMVVDVANHEATVFEKGVRTHRWEVGQGQAEGQKRVRGDLKTPRGLYFVTSKSTGPFSGPVSEYFGGHWVKVNYPNPFDASAGGLDAEKVTSIGKTWWRRALTPQNTALGGGIGFHGWVSPWTAESHGFLLSWGCVVAHPEDVAQLYASLPVGAAVVLR